jgi:EAL domain-containing protein (putative c-di-GMP-specific phosphodiesterase class I)
VPRGVEALVRWQHPQHGLIGPDRFIALAEEGGLIDELTVQVLGMALDWLVPWCAEAPERAGLTLSINLSARSLGSADFVGRLHERCTASGMDPRRVIFELTETAAMDDPALALELLTRLRVQGFELSIDDFGTGYSSMVQLVRLPFSEVKVDRSFVMTATRSSESQAVIRSIVDLGHSLGLRVVAEGVEEQAAMDYLRGAGCDLAQGYLIARPMTAPALRAWWPARAQVVAVPPIA